MPSSDRVLALVVGAPRAGTFSLYEYFANHPQVSVSASKEPNYFFDGVINAEGMRRITTDRQYLQQFAPVASQNVLLEASPAYLRCTSSPHLIAGFAARHGFGIKIVVMLRDPLARAFSNWMLDRRQGHQRAGFALAFAADQARDHAREPTRIQYEYYRSGVYSADIAAYRAMFGAENVLAQVVDDPDRPRDAVAQSVAHFLGVSHIPLPRGDINTTLRPRNRLVQLIYGNRTLRRLQRDILTDSAKERLRNLMFSTDTTRPRDVADADTLAGIAASYRNDRAALAAQGFTVDHWA